MEQKTQQAFDTLKEFLCSTPLLQFSDFTKTFNITCDASGYAIGSVLSQGAICKDKPIAYTSIVLRGSELNYEVYKKEALAMIHGVTTFRPHVLGRKLFIVTDHKPLVWFKSADINTRVQKWRFKLGGYDYEIIYKPRKLNSNADALSRNPILPLDTNVITKTQQLTNDKEETSKITTKAEIHNQPIKRGKRNKKNINENEANRKITNKRRKYETDKVIFFKKNKDLINKKKDHNIEETESNENLKNSNETLKGDLDKNKNENNVIENGQRYPKRRTTKINYEESDISNESDYEAQLNSYKKNDENIFRMKNKETNFKIRSKSKSKCKITRDSNDSISE